MICFGWVTQDGFASHVGNVPGMMSVTSLYVPEPPTFVYLSALSAPDVDVAARLFGLSCAAHRRASASMAARETRAKERRMVDGNEVVVLMRGWVEWIS